MSNIDDMVSQILIENQQQKKMPRTNNIFIEFIRHIIHGWFGAFLIFIISIMCAYVLINYLSPFRTYTTKMEVMIMKEKDGNRDGSINAEVMSEITGWRTTYNKLDEVRIMLSRSVVDNMMHNCHFIDSAYNSKQKELGHTLSKGDSLDIYDDCLNEFTNAIQISFDEKGSMKTSLLEFNIKGHIGQSKRILVGLIKAYNEYTLNYANQCYDATLHCLAQSIDSVRNELNKLDSYDGDYSTHNFIIDLSQQTDNYLRDESDIEEELRNIHLQRQLLHIIRNYMTDMGKTYTIVPVNTGIDDPQINKVVIAFNDLVMRRSDYLTSMGEDAMRVKTITNQIEDQRKAIIVSIDKLTEAYNIRLAKFEKDNDASNARLATMPDKKLVKDYIQRERDIITPMYERLQQKYTETLIAKASEQAPARIVTPPYVEESLLMENNKMFMMYASFFAILLSFIYLWKLEIPERELEVEDILSKSLLPIWGILPDVKEINKFGPAMKSLMTRIEMENSHIILITSGYDHEGKTFFMNQMIEYCVDNEMDFEFYNWEDIESAKNVAREDPAKSISEVEDLKQIIAHNKGNGKYIIIDGGSYHENPELPILSRESDATIYSIRAQHSSLSSLDFCNYAVSEEILFNGAIVVCQSPVNKDYKVSFGSFDYDIPSSFGTVKKIIKRTI